MLYGDISYLHIYVTSYLHIHVTYHTCTFMWHIPAHSCDYLHIHVTYHTWTIMWHTCTFVLHHTCTFMWHTRTFMWHIIPANSCDVLFVIRYLTNMATIRNFEVISGKIMYLTRIPYYVRDEFVTEQWNYGDSSTYLFRLVNVSFVKLTSSSARASCYWLCQNALPLVRKFFTLLSVKFI